MRKVLVYCVALVFLSVCLSSYAGPSASVFIKEIEVEAKVLIKAGNVQKANETFASKFDMQIFGKRCLAEHWQELSSDERDRYLDLLSRNIKKNMAEKMLLTKEDVNFKIVTKRLEKEADGIIKIKNVFKVRKGDVDFGVYVKSIGSKYKVVDYDIDGALLSRNYQGHFNYIFRKSGKKGFFDKLEAKLVSSVSSNQ